MAPMEIQIWLPPGREKKSSTQNSLLSSCDFCAMIPPDPRTRIENRVHGRDQEATEHSEEMVSSDERGGNVT